MALTKKQISEAAGLLHSCLLNAEQVEPLTETYRGISVEDAYQIQLLNVKRRLADGRKIVGKKIGLTSLVMQTMFDVGESDYGHLLDDMLIHQGEGLKAERFIQPRVEGEIAFILDRDLKGPGVTPTEVLRATAGVVAALEIIDSRIKDWKIKIQDTVADNASSGAFVVGSKIISVTGLDLRHVGFVLTRNGRVTSLGAGAAVLGSPAQSVAWLANKMGEFGVALNAGEIVLSGAACAAVPISVGDSVHLVVDRIGEVGCFCE